MRRLTKETLMEISTRQSFERGKEYFQMGLVGDCERVAKTIRGEVEGSGLISYDVELTIGRRLDWHCSCPYDWEGACKHVVALGLAWIDDPASFPDRTEEKRKEREKIKGILEEQTQEVLAEFLFELLCEDKIMKAKFFRFLKENRF